jgi:hypothetical protein
MRRSQSGILTGVITPIHPATQSEIPRRSPQSETITEPAHQNHRNLRSSHENPTSQPHHTTTTTLKLQVNTSPIQ